MQTIVFLGTHKSGSCREAIFEAKEMGYFTVLLTDRKKWLRKREDFPDVHQMILVQDLLDKVAINEQIKILQKQGKQIQAFVSFIDPCVSTAAQISKELGLVEFSADALYKMEDKTRFRNLLKNSPMTPPFSICSLESDLNELLNHPISHFPVVLKPPVSYGSKDVLLVSSPEEFTKAIQYFKDHSPESPILIEKYVEGPQYLIELVVDRSKITIVAVIEQEVSTNNRFIITGYQMPALLPKKFRETLNLAIESIITDIGLTHGTCHLEMRLHNGEWKLIEINPRIGGGAINQLILQSTGINLVKETLKLYLGKKLDLKPKKHEFAYAHFITVDKTGRLMKVTGKNKATNMEGVKKVYIKPKKGTVLTPPLSMGHRYAYVLATAKDPITAKQIAKQAAKKIKFFLEPL